MLDPAELYRMDEDATTPAGGVLVHHLEGYVDAGRGGQLAVDHLLSTLPASVVATFDVDQLLDYRSRRPRMTFHHDHWADYEEPVLAIYQLRDLADTPFLLLTGPEPDTQWERFSSAVTDLVARLGVQLTVGLSAIPMAVPHTRPSGVTAHATRPELIADHDRWTGTADLPGSAAALLELRLGQAGHDAMGLAVHVPHYLAESDYPHAGRALLDHLAVGAGLVLPTEALTRAAEGVAADVERKVADSEQATKVVRALERRYDEAAAAEERPSLLAEDQPLPTADELGAEIEVFLSEQDHGAG